VCAWRADIVRGPQQQELTKLKKEGGSPLKSGEQETGKRKKDERARNALGGEGNLLGLKAERDERTVEKKNLSRNGVHLHGC